MAVRTARAGKISTMKRVAAEILKDALALPPKARAALAGSLLESLDTEVDEDAEAAWATEINRRVAELESRAVGTIPWAEVRRRLAAR
jgi:putative addiction module component (TIGR02574 family)